MAHYLITGRSGTGKSTICAELVKRGLRSYDGDAVEGLAGWHSAATGLHVKVDYSRVIDPREFHWNWDESTLDTLLTGQASLFLCGSADNQLSLLKKFDKVFVLTLKPDEQIARIMARTSHGYGQLPGMHKLILAEQGRLVEQAVSQGAIAIDASGSVKHVVDTIASYTHDS